jgi:hypothetical protein
MQRLHEFTKQQQNTMLSQFMAGDDIIEVMARWQIRLADFEELLRQALKRQEVA